MKKLKIVALLSIMVIAIAALAGCTLNKKSGGNSNSTKKEVVFYVDGKEYARTPYNNKGEYRKPIDPTKEGHKFIGWYGDESFTKPVTVTKRTKGQVKAYARFEKTSVTLYLNGELYKETHHIDLENEKPAKENLTFDGWYTNPECTELYRKGDTTATKLYTISKARVQISNGYEVIHDVLLKEGEKFNKPEMNDKILKDYMNPDSVFEFKSEGEEFDFEKPVTKNTVIDLMWESKGIEYDKIEGTDYYYVKNIGGFNSSEDIRPVISIPNKTRIDVGGNKEIKEVRSVAIEGGGVYMANTEKLIVNEGIKYISGLNSGFYGHKIKEVVLPKNSLKIIENCFGNMAKGVKLTIPNSVEKIINCFWGISPYDEELAPNVSENTYKIPNTVKTLALVPTNLEFEGGSPFVKENGMIFKVEGAKKTLVSVGLLDKDVLEIPEGVTHIQVGTLCSTKMMNPPKMLKLPSTWTGIEYNGLAADYMGANGEYTNPHKYLQSDDFDWDDLKSTYDVLANSIICGLSKIDAVDINTHDYPASLDTNAICDLTITKMGPYTMREVKDYTNFTDKVVFSAEVASGQPIKVNTFGQSVYFPDRKPKKEISMNSGDILTEEKIKNELELKANEVILKVTSLGKTVEWGTELKRNTILFVELGVTNTGFEYVEEDGNLTVTGFKKDTAFESPDGTFDVFVPKEISGKKITKIAPNAFEGENRLGRIFINADIEELGDNAFKNCANLKTVVINSDNFKRIGKNAFEDSGLEEITMPLRNLEEVGTFAFRCRDLKWFNAVEKEKETAMLSSPYGWYGLADLFFNEPIVGRYYYLYYGQEMSGGISRTKGGQLVRYMGKTQVQVKKNPTSDEYNTVDVHDIDFYAQAAAAAYSSTGTIQLGASRRSRMQAGENTPVFRYTVKTGAFNYIREKCIYDGEEQKTEIQFAVIKKVENRAFNDMPDKFMELSKSTPKYAERIYIYEPDEQPDQEVDRWITREDFNNEEIFEDGWWNNIKKSDADYSKVEDMTKHANGDTVCAIG